MSSTTTFAFDGTRLRAAREAAGISRERLAYDVGRTHQCIVGYENGRLTPTIAALILLADTLGVEPGDFFTATPTLVPS
jgi:transcriptional regulator with XRE-family HTH domain